MTKVQKSETEWRALLSAEEYRVTREKGTERAFTGEYWNAWADGKYRCRCCGEILFEADTKFESGCGWPSFYQPADSQSIAEEVDTSHGMMRTEVMCSNCGAHLGHVFPDGPQPTGLRYCINSVSVKLDPEAS
jgi:peptide-methionine (R)-S-oxide reductase